MAAFFCKSVEVVVLAGVAVAATLNVEKAAKQIIKHTEIICVEVYYVIQVSCIDRGIDQLCNCNRCFKRHTEKRKKPQSNEHSPRGCILLALAPEAQLSIVSVRVVFVRNFFLATRCGSQNLFVIIVTK